jgi:hypothetical protein
MLSLAYMVNMSIIQLTMQVYLIPFCEGCCCLVKNTLVFGVSIPQFSTGQPLIVLDTHYICCPYVENSLGST